ncbi:MAG: preprotein translocase subunit SecY [Flavobacteriaceae bacterium]|nr:MAG: preprotein translocase subunit SecY [Flavobacteriaceae bacterium]
MGEFIKTIKSIFQIQELKDKILLTLGLLLVYRFGSYIPLPAIDMSKVDSILDTYKKSGGGDQAAGLLGLLATFTGGAFSRASIFALGIMPYISASIVMQLAGMAYPPVQKLQQDGESGRKKITQYTRWGTILICLIQAPAYLASVTNVFLPYSAFSSAYLIAPTSFWFIVPSVVLLIAGTMFCMWLGEKITDKGIGNGISFLIMIGILADLPKAILNEFDLKLSGDNGGAFVFFLEILVWIGVIMLSIILVQAVRKIALQYVSSNVRKGAVMSTVDAARQYIPLKLNAAGVMPIIFAQAMMFIPGLLVSFLSDDKSTPPVWLASLTDIFGLGYNIVFAILIIVFTFFYTAISMPVKQMSDDLKRSGAIIPKVKPGDETAEYIDDILSKITLPGAIFLAFLAILPSIVVSFGVSQGFALFFGGTSLIIMVGVILDTIQQINTYLLNNHYDGLMESSRSNSRRV